MLKPMNERYDVPMHVICANCFIKDGDKYLVIRRSLDKKYIPGFVHPIGGRVEVDEDPLAGALREVYEESGLKVDNVRLKAVFLELRPVKGEPNNWLIFHFMGDYRGGKPQKTTEGELVWLTAEELKTEKLIAPIKMTIEHILDDRSVTIFATFDYDEQKQTIIKSDIKHIDLPK